MVGSFHASYALFEIPSGAMADRIGARKSDAHRRVVVGLYQPDRRGLELFHASVCPLRFRRRRSRSISRKFLRDFPLVPRAERGRAHGIVWMASRSGGAFSPLLVIPIQIAYGWRMSFYVFGIFGLIWCVVWYWWYRDTPRKGRRHTR